MNWSLHGLRLPVLLAPMAGGPSTPALAAAVADAGGVGGLGFAYSPPDRITAELAELRVRTTGIINANFFIFPPCVPVDRARADLAIAALARLPIAHGVDLAPPMAPYAPPLAQQLEAVWQHRPQVLTFHFGLPPADVRNRAHALGMAVGISATCLDEAREIERFGADFVIAQGIEAGGHRGFFDPDRADDALPTLDLLQRLRGIVRLPLVAAGGIMTGRDIRRALDTGAAAVQMGTAFLACDECGASAEHKRAVTQEHDRGTRYTRAFSGRPAQGICNEFMRRMDGTDILPFPAQNTLGAKLRQKAQREHDMEYQALWAGSGYRACRTGPASVLLRTLEEELRRA